jgi:Na+-transporting NADH:ubiquinone oxidoreductase subunit NqrB
VNSLGFLKGAMHCLNTMDQKMIHQFASTILVVDYEATLATEILLAFTGEKAFRVIFKGIKGAVAWAKFNLVPESLNLKIVTKRVKLFLAGGLIVGLGSFVGHNIIVVNNQQKDIRRILYLMKSST